MKDISPQSFQSLNGTWSICFDPENMGRSEQWHKKDVFEALKSRRDIPVPSCWEAFEQDYEGVAYEGVAFYQTSFEVDVSWKDQVVMLHFDAVNYLAQVWMNGVCLGEHEGGYGSFSFRVDDALKWDGENFLSLRVLGPIVATDQVIDGMGPNDMPHWRGSLAAGIWQDVHLTCHSLVHVADLFIVPDIHNGKAEVRMDLANRELDEKDVQLNISILNASDRELVTATKQNLHTLPGLNAYSTELHWDNVQCWSPQQPHLYLCRVEVLVHSKIVDTREERFGMREFTMDGDHITLNGKPIVVKAAFFEGLYAEGLGRPDSEAIARQEIQLALDAGFNMIRPWRKPPPPMWLDLCDEMGVLVVGGMPIECMDRWPTVTPQLPARIENEVRSAIMRDRNRACIVQWEIFNEIWRKELARLKHSMAMLARQLDPSRLILDESGGFAGGANLYLPDQCVPITFNDIHIYPGAPLSDHSFERQFLALSKTEEELVAMGLDPKKDMNQHSKPGRLTFVSEIGYGSLPDLEDNEARFQALGNAKSPAYRYHHMLGESFRTALKECELESIYANLSEFCQEQQLRHGQANLRMIEGIRCNPSTRGYCVHALTDGDWVLGAGLLDLFRQTKTSYDFTKKANAPRLLVLRAQPRNVYAEQGATIIITGINELDATAGQLSLTIKDDNDQCVLQLNHEVQWSQGVSTLSLEKLNTSTWSGVYKIEVQYSDSNGHVLAQTEGEIQVFAKQDFTKPTAPIAAIDPEGRLAPLAQAYGIDILAFHEDLPIDIPVLVCNVDPDKDGATETFKSLESFVSEGGTAIYLEVFKRPEHSFWAAECLPKSVLPVPGQKQHGLGLWIGVSHVVRQHPIFEGLPSNMSMGDVYENVWTPFGLRDVDGKDIVTAISHGFHSDATRNQHHMGPEPAWHSMEVGEVSRGKGRYVLSALRLMEWWGVDPVADKIALNIMRWAGQSRHIMC